MLNKINQPKVTVIIVAYNAEGMRNIFKECLDAALNFKYDNYEVIVVNNGSTDRTKEILDDYEKDLKVINLKKNIGATGARNITYENSKSEFVLLFDSDAIPEQDSLKELIKIGINNRKIGILSGIQVDYKKRNITMLGYLFDIYGNYIITNYKELNIGEIKESYYTYIPAFLLVKRDAVGNILHPKEFFVYSEDIELCFRIWSKGYYVKSVPIIVCRHEFGTSIKTASKTDQFLYRKLNYHHTKNHALLLSVYRKLLPKIYAIQVFKYLFRLPIIETANFFRNLPHKMNSDFIGKYYPLKGLTYVKYSMKKLSTINEYGDYVPLSLKLKNSKKFLFNPINTPFNPLTPIKLDYEKMIVNDIDIRISKRKFIVTKLA
jgi:GT2 family glycosyltransferase